MRVAEVHIEGFGRLANRHYRFGPGFNLVFGANESGKSALHEALFALLFGFASRGGIDRAQEAAEAAWRPWDQSTFYAGAITYVLDNGRAFRASRRFLPKPEASLRTHPDGVDVSGRFKGASHGRLYYADEHLGVSREEFESICVARQGESLALEPDASLVTVALLRLLASAPADPVTGRAIAQLEAALQDEASVQAGAIGSLSEAMALLSALQEEREQAVEGFRDRSSHVAAVEQASRRVEALEQQREQLVVKKEEAERSGPGAQLTAAEVRRCEAEAARWRSWADFPAESRDAVLRLSAQRTHLRDECANLQRRAAQAQETIQALQAQEASLRQRAGGFEGPELPDAELPDLHGIASEWTAAAEFEEAAYERCRTARAALETLERTVEEDSKPLEAAIPLGLSGLSAVQQRLRNARERLAQAKGALSRASAQWSRFGYDEGEFRHLEAANLRSRLDSGSNGRQGGAISSLLGRLGRSASPAPSSSGVVQAQAAYDELLRGRAEAQAAQQALSDLEATTFWQLGKLLGGTLEDSAFLQLSQRLERRQQMVADVEQQRIAVASLESELDQARDRREKLQQNLQAQLTRLGFDASNPQKALATYMKRRERKGHLSQEEAEHERLRLRAETELELLRLRMGALQEELRSWRERQASLESTESQLRTLLAGAGIASASTRLDDALAAYDEAYENHRLWEKAQTALENALRLYQSIQASQVTAGADALRGSGARTAGRRAQVPVEPEPTVEEYAAQIEQLDEQLTRAREEHRRLTAALQQAGSLRHLSEIDEDIAATQADIRRLERFRDAVELARDELVAASQDMQKQYTPGLEFIVADGLRAIVGERYAEVSVDPQSLAVAIRSAEAAAVVPVEYLGASTRDLAQLLLRAAVARTLGRGGEKLPLFLDEPLAFLDEDRRLRALEYLVRVGETTQVFFLTADERLRAHFAAEWGKSTLHQLTTINGNQ